VLGRDLPTTEVTSQEGWGDASFWICMTTYHFAESSFFAISLQPLPDKGICKSASCQNEGPSHAKISALLKIYCMYKTISIYKHKKFQYFFSLFGFCNVQYMNMQVKLFRYFFCLQVEDFCYARFADFSA
jgi:hypothetical protein